MNEPEMIVVADRDAGAAEAATRIATILADAAATRGRADWATTGGSTPIAIYRHLVASPLADIVPWRSLHVWWGDDRYVPFDHPNSNVKPLDDILLDIAGGEEGTGGGIERGGADRRVPLPFDNVHRFPSGEAIGAARSAAWSAARLAETLRAAGLDEQDGWPILDLMILGVGGDGHVLSVFPGSDAFDSMEVALAIPAPTHIEPHVERVTLNPALVGAARNVLVVAYGADKAPVIGEIFGTERDPRRWPAQLARREGAAWILDGAAAADIPAGFLPGSPTG